VAVEISAVPLKSGERVVGFFGLISETADDRALPPDPRLTPRQIEVLRLFEQGRSTKQIAAELHLSSETVKNHMRGLFRALGVNSRLEAGRRARHPALQPARRLAIRVRSGACRDRPAASGFAKPCGRIEKAKHEA
jgi:DNA-binding CsgD family transcriptional regulator